MVVGSVFVAMRLDENGKLPQIDEAGTSYPQLRFNGLCEGADDRR